MTPAVSLPYISTREKFILFSYPGAGGKARGRRLPGAAFPPSSTEKKLSRLDFCPLLCLNNYVCTCPQQGRPSILLLF